MNTQITNEYLNEAVESGKNIVIYLVNGIKLEGKFIGYDDASIKMTSNKENDSHQLVSRLAISTIKASTH